MISIFLSSIFSAIPLFVDVSIASFVLALSAILLVRSIFRK